MRGRCFFRVLFVLSGCFCAQWVMASPAIAMGNRPHPPSSWIRVAVMQKEHEVTLGIRGTYRILTTQTNEVLAEGRSLSGTIIKPTEAGVLFGKDPYKLFGIRIVADRTKSITVNGRKYRGLVEILREPDLTLTVVNRVGIEEYIYGVLRHEVAPWWPLEALKAQAVISRTYASYQRSIRQDEDYDVTGDVLSQVYGGAKGETRRIRRASRSTWGEVLHWEGAIFPTYYSSTCGGHTEAANELWKIDIKPLSGKACPFCTISKHYLWDKRISLELVRKKLRWRKYDVGSIHEVKVTDRTVSGRVRQLKIMHEGGAVELSGHLFRMHLGPDLVRSTLFDLSLDGRDLILKGKGWGHGAGLCQWGTYAQARQDKGYREILSFYYPGSTLVQTEPEPS